MTEFDTLRELLEYPLGSADAVFERFAALPGAVFRGSGKERFLFVPGTRTNKVVLIAHADTHWDARHARYPDLDVSMPRRVSYRHGDFVSRSARSGIGADDRAGCAMLWLLRDMGHALLVPDCEEGGLIGSRWLMDANPDIADLLNRDHQFMVEFDRQHAREFKCYEVGTDAFRAYVADKTGYTEPDRLRGSDIKALCRDICGVNLSVGYADEHTPGEYIRYADWKHTLDMSRAWLSEPDLPRFDLPKAA
ncbi:MAG: hypothetical protein HZB53_16110 [Chloroflexi bacterium]|nr:hypothetical protein [Chloroflexota bacterium]